MPKQEAWESLNPVMQAPQISKVVVAQAGVQLDANAARAQKGPLSNREFVTVQNNSANSIEVSFQQLLNPDTRKPVSPAPAAGTVPAFGNGMLILANTSVNIDIGEEVTIWAISGTGNNDVRLIEYAYNGPAVDR